MQAGVRGDRVDRAAGRDGDVREGIDGQFFKVRVREGQFLPETAGFIDGRSLDAGVAGGEIRLVEGDMALDVQRLDGGFAADFKDGAAAFILGDHLGAGDAVELDAAAALNDDFALDDGVLNQDGSAADRRFDDNIAADGFIAHSNVIRGDRDAGMNR